jgi:starch synthase
MSQKLKILVLSAEVTPFVQVGGLADVAGALPKALRKLGHDVRVALPRYRQIDGAKFGLKRMGGPFQVGLGAETRRAAAFETNLPGSDVPVYFIWDERFFYRDGVYGFDDDAQRFAFFGRAVLALIERLDWQPDVIHCNDWHTALVPVWLSTIGRKQPFFQEMATVYSIHNLGYQGFAGRLILRFAGLDESLKIMEGIEDPGQFNFMARGIRHADIISTVSPSYAAQILTDEWGGRLAPLLRARSDHLVGALRGLDHDRWNPSTDPHLLTRYSVEQIEKRIENKRALLGEMGMPVRDDIPLIGMVSRLVDQKGCDIAGPVVRRLLRGDGGEAYFVLLGVGLPKYHAMFSAIGADYYDRARVIFKFDAPLAHRIFAASDILLMPSLYEPCGTEQMAAMRYGCVPVVRSVGGLADTVSDFQPAAHQAIGGGDDLEASTGNGFAFTPYDVNACWDALCLAIETRADGDTWRALQKRGMTTDHSWEAAAPKYVELYHRAIQVRRG